MLRIWPNESGWVDYTGLKLLHGSANESETVIAATFAHEELCIKTIFYLVRSTQVKEK